MDTPKSRSPSMTDFEKQFLLTVVKEFLNIIDNKRRDVESVSLKEQAWKEIEKRFCAQPNFPVRSSTQLKNYWRHLKRNEMKLTRTSKKRPGESVKNGASFDNTEYCGGRHGGNVDPNVISQQPLDIISEPFSVNNRTSAHDLRLALLNAKINAIVNEHKLKMEILRQQVIER